MKEHSEVVKAIVYPDMTSLTEQDRALILKSKEVAENAYAPYSRFKVGAVVLLENGKTVFGSNQENVAYPSGLCAERVALFSAGSNYPGVAVKMVAISAIAEKFSFEDVITPCGGCRQVIMECQLRQETPIRLLLASPTGKVVEIGDARNLLPFAFDSKGLRN